MKVPKPNQKPRKIERGALQNYQNYAKPFRVSKKDENLPCDCGAVALAVNCGTVVGYCGAEVLWHIAVLLRHWLQLRR